MISPEALPQMDIRDIALVALIHAAHQLMTGRGWLAMVREAARLAAKHVVVRYLHSTNSIETCLERLDNILHEAGPLKAASAVRSSLQDGKIQIHVRGCVFTKICLLIEDLIRKRPDIVERVHVRPCAIAILYSATIEQMFKKTYDLTNCKFGETCTIELSEFKL
ncbi:MAG: hypothetical protein GXO23_02825 [Crenarchaeota archaeon]|nr:hypothetical protein [Thermoproteota archaeon]